MDYSRIFGSQFPNSLIEYGTKKDVDDTVIDLVNRYYNYISSNNMTAANALYEANKELLEPYSVKMKDFNLLLEDTHNIGLYALKQTKIVVDENMPATMSDNGIWYEVLEDIE